MREIPITPEIKAAITRVNGGVEIDVSKVAVFESRSLNTRPLRRRTGLFAGAITQKITLDEMAASLNSSDEGLPLHIMHETDLLNVGRLFSARVDQNRDGAWELSSQFYIDRSEDKLIAKINSGVTDQVSIGINGRELNCSACGFDYKKGSIDNLMNLTCDEGHEIGHDGVHLLINGLDQWIEQSIVDTGASKGARIVAANDSRFINSQVYQLAAKSHQNDSETFMPLIANLRDIISEEIPTVDEAKFEALLTAKFAEQNTATETAIAAKQKEVDAAVERAETAEAALAEAQKEINSDAVTELAAAKTELETAIAYLKDQATKAQVAAGVKAPVEATDIAAAIALIQSSGKNLVNLFAKDAQDEGVDKGSVKLAKLDTVDFRAFQRNQPRK